MEQLSPPRSPRTPWRVALSKNGGAVASPRTPQRVSEALKEIAGSPSPSVQTLVKREKEKEKARQMERERERERETKRQDMLREASLLRAVRRRRADAAREALRVAERQLADAEEATPIEVKNSMAEKILVLRRELRVADEEHLNACLLEKECISDVQGSPEKLNHSVKELMNCPTPKALGSKELDAGPKLLQDELCEGGNECIANALELIDHGDPAGARRQLREARELFLDAGDEILNDKLVEIQSVERLADKKEREQALEKREAAANAIRGVASAIEDGRFRDAWKLLGQAEASAGALENGSNQFRQELEDWEGKIRLGEERRRERDEAERETRKKKEREAEEALEALREKRRHKEVGDENLELAMEALKKDNFSLAKTLVIEAGASYDRAGVDMRSGIAAILQRAILGEKLTAEKKVKEQRDMEEKESEKQRNEEARAQAEQDEKQRMMHTQLGDNALRDAKLACSDRKDFLSGRRLVGLAEAAYARAGGGQVTSDARAMLESTMAVIRQGEEESARVAMEQERISDVQERAKTALEAARALAGEGDFVRAQGLWQEARALFASVHVDHAPDMEKVARQIVSGQEIRKRMLEEEKRNAEREEKARQERAEMEKGKAAEEERRMFAKKAEDDLILAAQAFTQDWDFQLARSLVESAEDGFTRAGNLEEVRRDLEGMLSNIEEAEKLAELHIQQKEKEAEEELRGKVLQARAAISHMLAMLENHSTNNDFIAARMLLTSARQAVEAAGIDMTSEFDEAEESIRRREKLEEHARVEEQRAKKAWVDSGDDLLRQTLQVLSGGGSVAEARRKLERVREYYQKGKVLNDRDDQIAKVASMITEADAAEKEAELERDAVRQVQSGMQSLADGRLDEALALGEKAHDTLKGLKKPTSYWESAGELVERVKKELERKARQQEQLAAANKAIESASRALELHGDVHKAQDDLEAAVSRLEGAGHGDFAIQKSRMDQIRGRIATIEDRERNAKIQKEQESAAREAILAAAQRIKATAFDAVALVERGLFGEAKQNVRKARQDALQIPNIDFSEILRLEEWIGEMQVQDAAKKRDDERRKDEEIKRLEEIKNETVVREAEEERIRVEEAERLKRKQEADERLKQELREKAENDAREAKLAAERLVAERQEAIRQEQEAIRCQDEARIAAELAEANDAKLRFAEEKRQWEKLMAAQVRREEELRRERERVLAEAAEEAAAMRHRERMLEDHAEEEQRLMKERLKADEKTMKSDVIDSVLSEAKLALEEGDYVRARICLKNVSLLAIDTDEEKELLCATRSLEQDIDNYELDEAKQISLSLAGPGDCFALPRSVSGSDIAPRDLVGRPAERLSPPPRSAQSDLRKRSSPQGLYSSNVAAGQSQPARESLPSARLSSLPYSTYQETVLAGSRMSYPQEARRDIIMSQQLPEGDQNALTHKVSQEPQDKTLHPWSTQEQHELDLIMGGLTGGANTHLPSMASARAARARSNLDFLKS